MPALRSVDPEKAHALGVQAGAWGLLPKRYPHNKGYGAVLSTSVFGLNFRSPIGLAAGFDKQGEAMSGFDQLGFGFVEVGTVTPLPQPGNPQPRMFRLPDDRAVINRFGFNSDGLHVVADRIVAWWTDEQHDWYKGLPLLVAPGVVHTPRVVLGINIGKNKEGDAISDYTEGTKHMALLADYLTVNISSPNTPGLRNLQAREQLRALLVAVKAARDSLPWSDPTAHIEKPWFANMRILRYVRRTPPAILVKISPDCTPSELEDIAAVVMEVKIDGVIVSNTTIARPDSLHASADVKAQAGGLSGAPLFGPSTVALHRMYQLTGGKVPLVGAGGVSSGADAYAKIRAGASLVQLYTALAYEGPGLVERINKELEALLVKDGYSSVAEAVGADHRELKARA